MASLCRGLLLPAVLALGPGDKDAGPGKASPEPVKMVARFRDGSVIRQVHITEAVQIETKYGKLEVPVGAIRRVEFGARLSEETAKEVEEAIRALGGKQFADREAATKKLAALGFRAYPALQQAARIEDKEVARRAAEVLRQVEQTTPAKQLQLKPHDLVYTDDSVLAGRIVAPALKARTATFGEMALQLAELASLHRENTRASLTVESERFDQALQRWQDTGVTLLPGEGLHIVADGQIDLNPRQAGNLLSGPEGNGRRGANGNFVPGTLLGRIGERGQPFVIGQQYLTRAGAGGKLYVYVVPAVGLTPKGSYHVNVTNGMEVGGGQQTPTTPVPPQLSMPLRRRAAPPVGQPAPLPPGGIR